MFVRFLCFGQSLDLLWVPGGSSVDVVIPLIRALTVGSERIRVLSRTANSDSSVHGEGRLSNPSLRIRWLMSWPEAESFEHQPWAEAVNRVLSEKDSSKVGFCIETAKTAIALRLNELSELPNPANWRREINAINHAIDFLGGTDSRS